MNRFIIAESTGIRLAPEADLEGDARPAAPMEFGCDIGADEAVATLAVPTEPEAFAYAPAQRPHTVAEAAQTRPLACGDLSEGTLDLELKLPRFTGLVDVYLGLYFPALDPDNVYLITDGNALQPVSAGLTPWRASTDGNIHTRLLGEVPLSAFPAGDYTLGVIVTPAGSFSTSYLWATAFSP